MLSNKDYKYLTSNENNIKNIIELYRNNHKPSRFLLVPKKLTNMYHIENINFKALEISSSSFQHGQFLVRDIINAIVETGEIDSERDEIRIDI